MAQESALSYALSLICSWDRRAHSLLCSVFLAI